MSNQWHNVVLNSLGMFEIWNRKIAIWIQKWKFKNQNSPRTRLHTTLLEPSLGCWQAACYTTKHSILEPKPYRHDRNSSSSSHCTLTYVASHLGCQWDHCTRSPSVNVPSEHEGGKVGLFTPYSASKEDLCFFPIRFHVCQTPPTSIKALNITFAYLWTAYICLVMQAESAHRRKD